MALGFGKREKQLVGMIIGGTIIFVLYLNLFFKPTIAGLREVNPELYRLTQDIRRVEHLIKEQTETEKRLKELQSQESHYEKALSNEEEIPSLLEELSHIAGNSGVEIIGIRPQRKLTPDLQDAKIPYEEIPISISAKCGYHKLGRFVSKLEGAKRLFAVKDIDVKGNPRNPKMHDVKLIVSAFLVSED